MVSYYKGKGDERMQEEQMQMASQAEGEYPKMELKTWRRTIPSPQDCKSDLVEELIAVACWRGQKFAGMLTGWSCSSGSYLLRGQNDLLKIECCQVSHCQSYHES